MSEIDFEITGDKEKSGPDFSHILLKDAQDIYKYFLETVLPDTSFHSVFFEELKNHDRYTKDAAFRLLADLVDLIFNFERNETSQRLVQCLDLIDRAMAMEMWFIVANSWNVLGNAYQQLRMRERAIECYSRVADVEKKHGLSNLTLVSYYNLGLIYYDLDLKEKALCFFRKAIKELKAHPPGHKRYYAKLFDNYAAMIQLLCKMHKLEEATEIYQAMKNIDRTGLSWYADYLFYQGELFYTFLLYDEGLKSFDDCKQAFLKTKEYLATSGIMDYASFIYTYIDLCMNSNVKFEEFENVIHEAEDLLPSGHYLIDASLFGQIKTYYKYKGDTKCFDKAMEHYAESLEILVDQYKAQQCHSVEILETLLLNNETKNEVSIRNLELKFLFDEAMRVKGELQDAYKHIENISSLGRKLTSTLDLREVVYHFNEMLKNHVDLDSFALLMYDEDKCILRSLMAYQNGIMIPEIIVDCEDEGSQIARCYRTRSVVYWDESIEKNVQRVYENEELPMLSAVYLPLMVEDRVIGVYTLQHRDRGVYRDKLDFLQDLGPYVSIALNNAMKSWSLEKEIESHIITQQKLKAANRSLEKISHMDGLTHISSRRYFEKKINEMLEQAEEEGCSLSTLMLDIDDFKFYNDSYGHLEGDAALKAVAKVFKMEMEKVGGLSARFGGEEFVGACKGLSYNDSFELAERIRKGIYDLNIEHRSSKLGRLSVSVGLSYGRGVGMDAKSMMLRLADEMLYKAKNNGKNQVAIGYYQGA